MGDESMIQFRNMFLDEGKINRGGCLKIWFLALLINRHEGRCSVLTLRRVGLRL